MEKLVLKAIEKFSLINGEKTVTVALSGGADSMSLLYSLNSIKDELGFTLKAAHLNHGIRGEEADRDAEFVKKQCEILGVELISEFADVPKYAKENGYSLELAARKLRYEFLERIADGCLVATAHTASDNLETMIFNLTRGSGADGLCGIPAKRGIFIRPLLLATRTDVEEYCNKNNIHYVTDTTNLSDDYSRNKIRHNVIPVLKELNPRVEESSVKTADILREDSSYIKAVANEFLAENLNEGNLILKDFGLLDVAVKKRVITKFIELHDSDISLETVHIESILKICENGGKTNLPKSKHGICKKGELFIKNSDASNKIPEFKVEITENTQKINNLLLNNSIDCDKIVGKSELRTRMVGDSIRICGRPCTKSLNKWFNETGVAKEERDYIPVLADEKGPIWVFGLGVAQRCAVTSSTKRMLQIKGEKI